MYRNFFKPLLDLLISITVLLITSPLFILAAVLLAIANKGKIFFLQQRPGKHERIFRIIKFKTMNDKRDKAGQLLPDAERLTAAGRFIRKTSIDELPQLINVMKGDMSLVGPRPLLVEYLPLYNDTQKRRHLVKPGITGWAQVNGRNTISWEQKFAYDVWYADRISFGLDMKIIWLTVLKVFRSEGITQQGQATAEKYTGNTISESI